MKSSRQHQDISDQNSPTSLPGILVSYLLNLGCKVPEIASAAEVSRASVYNWLKGREARNPVLLKIIRTFELGNPSFEDICPQASQLSRAFDPHSLELMNKYEEAKARFESMLDNSKPRSDTAVNLAGTEFKSGFLQQYGKAIFEAAFRHEKLGGSLVLVCTDESQRESAGQIWHSWVTGFEYSSDVDLEVMSQLGVSCSDEQFKVFLSDVADSFPTLLNSCRRIFGQETSLRLRLDDKPVANSELILLEFEWETSRYSDAFIATDYLFTWVSDVDGRRVCERLFHWIKEEIKHGSMSLQLFVHDGYFADEVMDDDDDDDEDIDKPEITLLSSEVLSESIPVNTRMNGFYYGCGDDLDVHVSIDGRKVFFSKDGVRAVDFFSVPTELPAEAFEYLFPILGYQIAIRCDTPQDLVHSVTISW